MSEFEKHIKELYEAYGLEYFKDRRIHIEKDTNELRLIVRFHEALYDMKCPECDTKLTWELVPDPDSLHYFARCCGMYYTISPEEFIFDSHEAEDDELF